MSRARVIENAKRYVVIVKEENLLDFKRACYANDVTPSAIVRCLMEDYAERMDDERGGRRLRIDIVYGIIDQMDLLSDKKNKFKLNDLVCNEAMKFISEVRRFTAAYLNGVSIKNHTIKLPNREFITVTRGADGVYTMKSSAHDCIITVKGFFFYVQMPKTFSDCGNSYAKYYMVNNLLVTLTELTLEYRNQTIEMLSKIKNTPMLKNEP